MARIGLMCFDVALITENGDEYKTTAQLNIVPGFDEKDEENEEEKKKAD